MKSTRTFFRIALIFIIAFQFFTPAVVNSQALQPVKLSMQGILKNFDGTIVTNGYYDVTFKLYTVSTGGTAVWSEDQTVLTNGGVYNTVLGKSTAGLNALQALSFSTTYYLGITVEGSQEMNPRMEITGSAMAIRTKLSDEATHALDADHADLADFATNAGHANNADMATNAGHANNADLATNATNANYATTAGTANIALALSGSGSQSFANDVWHFSNDGKNRFHFWNNSTTHFGSPNGFCFRNASDATILTIGNDGATTLARNVYHRTDDGKWRFYFADNSTTYFLTGGNGFGFQNTSLQTVFAIADDGTTSLANGVWHKTNDGKNRFHFSTNGTTYFGSQDGFRFQNAGDATILTIGNDGNTTVTGNLQGNHLVSANDVFLKYLITFDNGGYRSYISNASNMLVLNAWGDNGDWGSIDLQTKGVTRLRVNPNEAINQGQAAVNIYGNLSVDGQIIHKTDVWHKSSDGKNRVFYANGTHTYFGSGEHYVFQNNSGNQIFAIENTGVVNMQKEVWHKSSDDKWRFFFQNNSATFFGSPNGYKFQDASDATIFTILNDGGLLFKSDVWSGVGEGVWRLKFDNYGITHLGSWTGFNFYTSNDGTPKFSITVNGAINLANDQWHKTLDGQNRFYFSPNEKSYFGSPNGFSFQSSSNQPLFVVENTGILSIQKDVWHKSSDNKNRFAFVENGNTNFNSGNRYIFYKDGYQLMDLDPAGNVFFTGNSNAVAHNSSSDKRFKKDISPLKNSLQTVLQIQGVNYYWRQNEFPEKMFNDRLQIGIVAQDLEMILPELVSTDENGYKTINYAQLTPVLIEAIKELKGIIETQEATIQNLKTDATTLKSENADFKIRLEKIESYLNAISSK